MIKEKKQKIKVKELAQPWKEIKKEQPVEEGEEEREEEGLESEVSFKPRTSSLDSPVLESSDTTSQFQLVEPREREKKEETNQVQYETATIYNIPDYSPSRAERTNPREPVMHPVLISEQSKPTTRVEEWHELREARQHMPERQDAVISAGMIERDNKLPFQQDHKYKGRKKAA